MSQDQFSSTERTIILLATPLENYGTLGESFAAIAESRQRQFADWPETKGTDAGGRTAEQWLILIDYYTDLAKAAYARTGVGTPEGRALQAKYAAILANLSLWYLQSTVGPVNDDKRAAGAAVIGAVGGCRFHSSTPYPTECGPADN